MTVKALVCRPWKIVLLDVFVAERFKTRKEE